MDILYFLARQGHQVLSDAEKHLSLYLAVVFPEEFEIRKESS